MGAFRSECSLQGMGESAALVTLSVPVGGAGNESVCQVRLEGRPPGALRACGGPASPSSAGDLSIEQCRWLRDFETPLHLHRPSFPRTPLKPCCLLHTRDVGLTPSTYTTISKSTRPQGLQKLNPAGCEGFLTRLSRRR